MQRFRKTVLGMLVGSFSACLAASVFIHLYYYETLPSVPDERAARTVKMEVNHGFVRYGSGGELRAFHLIQDVLFPVACLLPDQILLRTDLAT
jgi:hypothetical protein